MELYTTLLAVGSLWLVAVIVPGPNFFILLQNGFEYGLKSSFFIVLGIAFGTAIWALSALLGITLLFQTAPWIYLGFKILGGAYLIYLGVKLILNSFKVESTYEYKIASRTNGQAFLLGMFTNLSNPKTALFVTSLFVTAIPLNPSIELSTLSLLLMVIISLFWYGMVSLLITSKTFSNFYASFKKYLDRTAGAVFVYFGGSILASR